MTRPSTIMLISYSHRFIFFHVAKVAGLSMREALKEYTQEPEKFKIRRPPKTLHGQANLLYDIWASSLVHAKAKDVQQEFPKEIYDSFYKFTFVRNPWDWQVSMYHFLLKETSNVRYSLVKSMHGFEEYLEWVIKTPHPYPKGATRFQKEMLTDQQGNIIVDFIGHYETLDQDFHSICQKINIQAKLPHVNKTVHHDYRSYYNSRTEKMVAEYFKEDIELFGYTFDNHVVSPLVQV